MASPSIDDILAEVDLWFSEHFARPPISHDVAAYNQAYVARADLKARLTALVSGKAAPAAPASEPASEDEQPSSSEAEPKPKSKPAA